MEIFNDLTNFHVVKRDNTSELFQIKKIMLMVEWACDKRNVSPVILYDRFVPFLVDGMKTKVIQEQLIKVALSLTSIEEPDWADVAGSLLLLNIYKNHREYMRDQSIFGYSHLYDFIIAATNDLLIDQELVEKYSKNDIDSINEEIDIEYDDFDYSGINLMDKRYLIKYGDKTVEPPQFMYVLTAMVVFKNVSDKVRRLELIKEYYTLMALQVISPATPNLSNLRKYGRGSSPSCFILKAEDDLESIYDVNKMAAIISKNGGASGISLSSIRASGSPIKGVKNAAKGVLPWMRLFNDTAVAVDQLGTRTGAITVTLDVWHKDIFDFLDMRKENIDLRLQSQDLFGQIAVNDVFLEVYNQSVKNQSRDPDWLTFCPYVFKELTGIEIENTWGETFREAYNHAVSLYEKGELYNAVKVSSRVLMKKVLEAAKESGLPYWFNKDYVNQCNPNKHRGVINSSNLCVAPETKILTDAGYLQIDGLVGQEVNVWNGEEWSNVRIVKTGENQKLLKVTLSSGNSLECTPYHKWYIQNDYSGKISEKRTHELVPGDKLIKFDLPTIDGKNNLLFAYDNGFFSADGNTYDSLDRIYLYHDKRNLEPFFRSVSNWNYDEKQNRSIGRTIGLKDKFFVPNSEYTIKSRIDWLSGFLDGDGTIVRNGMNESIQAASIHKEFLILIQEMLQTLGVHSKVSSFRSEGDYFLPVNDGTGESKEYHCKEIFRLLISSTGLYRLSALGLKTNRLSWKENFPQRNAERFITILKIEDEDRHDDTYCFTEFKRNMGMFNGILTGQCTESFSTFNAEYSHVCIAEGELVLTSDGYVPIEESDNKRFYVPFVDDSDFRKEQRYVSGALIDNGTKEIFNIGLKNGSSIRITDNHPILVTELGNKTWKTLRDISIGDKIVVSIDEISNSDNLIMNDYSSIGWLLGDGWILDYRIGACFNKDESYALNIVSEFLENKLLPFKRKDDSRTPIQIDKNNVYSWSSGNKRFINSLVNDYSLSFGTGLFKRLPLEWYKMEKNDLANLLSGLFSADGTFCLSENNRNKPSVKLSSSSLQMMEDVKAALDTFGIKSGFCSTIPTDRNKQYTLSISSSYIPSFMERIGFILSPEKVSRYESIKDLISYDTYNKEYSEVKYISSAGFSKVYDISLENGHHFVCNGIVVHNCNLHSINLSKGIEEKDIERAVRMSVIALNQIVTLSTSPLESTRKHNDEFRIIGIGALGYHDHLVKKGMYYAKSSSYAYELFEKIAYWAIDESVNEVTHIGEYPAFSGSDWESGVFFGRSVYSEDFSDTPGMNEKWIRLYENKVSKFGMANGGLLAIAPNTGTSQLVNSSASILPVYSKFFTEKNKLMVVPLAAKYLSNETFWLYQEAINLDPNVVIEVCQNAQQWVDQGISMELVLNTNHYNDAKTLRNWYMKAMIGYGNKRSKTVYYLRPIQKGKEEGCTSCAN